jgi:hypothetical protein
VWKLLLEVDAVTVASGGWCFSSEGRTPLVGTQLASVAVGGVRCDEWFLRWQEAKKARQSRVRVNKKRGGAESTAARDRACWSKWWAPVLGSRLPHTVTQRDIMAVIDSMEKAGLAPLTIKTHWSVIKAFFGWLFEEDVLTVSPIAKAWVSADAVVDRVRDIVVPDFRFIDMLSSRLGTGPFQKTTHPSGVFPMIASSEDRTSAARNDSAPSWFKPSLSATRLIYAISADQAIE